MNNENTIRKSVQVISVIALIVGASGCATQSTGGSKLDHDQLMTGMADNENTVEICTQYGAKMSCHIETATQLQERFEYLQESFQR
jgi:hypothetical protein